MKIASVATAIALVTGLAITALPVKAATALYPTEGAAQSVCQADEVVFVDLDKGKYYHKAQAAYGKSKNGGFACLKAAHAQYRESHD